MRTMTTAALFANATTTMLVARLHVDLCRCLSANCRRA
ncbi:hypothetical protein N566_20835 [Streptomycetaceae bacterium MP113-05]|nr:hypothetical protein N566_20835 [Streptomycetaceae bacterium MP113-05]